MYPNSESDQEELAKLNIESWMVEQLRLNPNYVFWGPHEDCMWQEGEGWSSRVLLQMWGDFKLFELDDLNEVVNFYFYLWRPSEKCQCCQRLSSRCPVDLRVFLQALVAVRP